ncbi:MAG: hypothetical protein QM791_12240 [Ferruginibacter sp.]
MKKYHIAVKTIMIFYLLFCFNKLQAQNIVKVITITPGENAVTSSLPFDRPIILKWVSKEQVIVKYAGLQTIERGQVSEYYRNFAQKNDFYDLQNTTFGNDKVEIKDQVLTTTSTLNADGKFELNIFIPPLKPNKFYDIKIMRRPVGAELDLYVELFKSAGDIALFEKKLKQINELKKPFEHRSISNGKLRTADLLQFYETFLKPLYAELTLAAADNNKIAAAVSKIKGAIIYGAPADGFTQSLGYIDVFRAIRDGDNKALTAAIQKVAEMHKGYFPFTADNAHIGSLAISDLKGFYNKPENSEIQALLNKYDLEPDGTKKNAIQNKLASFIMGSSLPFADDMFIFGQTLSSTSAVLDFDTRTGYTITPDFGYVYYGFQKDFGSMTPYVGFQLEFRYFDKNIPFNLIRPKSLFHYLSFTAGLTLTSLKRDGRREDFFSGKSLLTGIGIRLTSATRITTGVIWFNREDINPLIDRKRLTVTPFAGLSIDLKLKSILNDFYSLIPTKKP